MNGIWKAVSVLALVVALVVGGSQVLGGPAPFEARTYGTDVYMEQGGAKLVVGSGGEVEFQSGATVDVQSGATFTINTTGYPLLYASAGQEIACGSQTITGTAQIATGLTTATYGIATLISDPSAGAGEGFLVTADAPTTSTLTVNVWQDDATAATAGEVVHWCAVGAQ
jgi:hypothetical protein